jgi:hypothetical protein
VEVEVPIVQSPFLLTTDLTAAGEHESSSSSSAAAAGSAAGAGAAVSEEAKSNFPSSSHPRKSKKKALATPKSKQTLLLLLQGSTASAVSARRLVLSAPPALRCLLLSCITLGWYYAHNTARVELFSAEADWRGMLKADKMLASVRGGWARLAGVDDAVLAELKVFFRAAWSEGEDDSC